MRNSPFALPKIDAFKEKQCLPQNTIELAKMYEFLSSNIKNPYYIESMPYDCSKRRYYRIHHIDDTSVLMDSSLDPSLQSFISMQKLLSSNNITVPAIKAVDLKNGMLLLQDLGNDTLTTYLKANPHLEQECYLSLVDVLCDVYKIKNYDFLPPYSWTKFQGELNVFELWYLKRHISVDKLQVAAKELYEIFYNWYNLYMMSLPETIVLSDFMADNIMIKDNKPFILDFQDALIGSPAYDIVSLLQDARRDVDPTVAHTCIEMFCSQLSLDHELLVKAYKALGLQRNLKIIGIFSRISQLNENSERYQRYLPRVWGHIKLELQHTFAQPLKEWFERYGLL